MTFQIASGDLGGTSGFYAWAQSTLVDDPPETNNWDDAPDGDAFYDYKLSTPQVASASARTSPAAPRAGQRFAVAGVSLRLKSDETVPASTFSCRATLGGKPIAGTGAGRCTFSLPRDAKNKRLAVDVTATLQGASTTLRRSFTVR